MATDGGLVFDFPGLGGPGERGLALEQTGSQPWEPEENNRTRALGGVVCYSWHRGCEGVRV